MKMQNIGGQAVIEGVMLRSSHYYAVAVRKDGLITTKIEPAPALRCASIPLLRGVVGLYDMLFLGMKSLLWSAEAADGTEAVTKKELFVLFSSSAVMAVFFFVILPFFAATAVTSSDGFLFNLFDGAFRLGIFVSYIGVISRFHDIKTLFQYHGAEHKVVNCYEQKKNITVGEAKKCSRIHPRCGTTFIMLILLASIAVFSLFSFEHWMGKILLRLFALPLLAGLAYELIKAAQSPVLRVFIIPGLWFQRITTREPTEEQLSVALAALNALIIREKAHVSQ